MSAARRSLAACCARDSALGFLKISKMLISADHEIGERAAQRLRMLAHLLGLLRQPHEPIRRIDILRVERDPSHYHGDLRLQPAAIDLKAISALTEVDRDTGGFRDT
jgi:hypothetical protein